MNIKNKVLEFFKNKKSYKFKTMIYLVLFSLGIILLLWVSQKVFLQVSYEHYKIKQMNTIVKKIENTSEDDLDEVLSELAYQNDICIELDLNFGSTVNYNIMQNSCGLGKNIRSVTKIKEQTKSENLNNFGVKLENPNNKSKAYLYGIKTNIGYVFIYSNLENIDSTATLLNKQLIYIVFIIILFAIIIAYFLSKKITEPIANITEKAKEMGKGNYNLTFLGNGTLEIDELAKTLNEVEQELAKTDEMRRDLMANVSHDLKTPLTMIKAYAEMVKDISYNDDEKREEHLNIIIDETDRLTLLVNDILDMTKEEANVDFLKLENYDLVKEVKNIVSKYEIIKETENYNIILETPKNALVKADKSKINQVIYNLINNAINYTGDDKKVIVRITEEESAFLVEIIDTGKGIDKKDLKYIWNKYYKQEKNHKRNIVGSGIGLSIVKSILERHNFIYGVTSRKNHGTTFYFKISKNK